MTAILKNHKINYIKMRSAYKRSMWSRLFIWLWQQLHVFDTDGGFGKGYHGLNTERKVYAGRINDTKETRAHTKWNKWPAGSQYSDIIANDNPPPNKKHKADGEDEQASDDELDDPDDSMLVPLSEEVATFLEVAFNTKLDNKARRGKAKAQGTPDSRWIWCAKIDPVVFANVSPTARTADRAVSKLQQFWLDAANPLVFILEKAEEMDLPKEVIGGIQQLMGNANSHNSAVGKL